MVSVHTHTHIHTYNSSHQAISRPYTVHAICVVDLSPDTLCNSLLLCQLCTDFFLSAQITVRWRRKSARCIRTFYNNITAIILTAPVLHTFPGMHQTSCVVQKPKTFNRPVEPVRSRGTLESLPFWCSFIIATSQIGLAVEIPQVHFIPCCHKQTAPKKQQVIMFKGNLKHKFELIHRPK